MAQLNPESEFKVTITDLFIRVEHPSIVVEQVFWNDIHQISIITTDQGPFNPDVWLTLLGDDGICQIPQGCAGYDEVYDIVSQYEGFDIDEVIKAMQSTQNNEFILWKRKS